ncbi:MAG: MATE family efflux transporter [Gammaproteobacteria bacterium]|nr:MATE family efflux transporter [Gammaproteobacteria bacterium]|tara:strand:- start:421 stop:1752 length:1332 start_codon:yes stop_codon:yes gene_type:complete
MSARDLTQGPVAGSLFRLTAPMMMGVSSNILVSMLEIGFIGQLGTEQVAAVTFTFPLVMILNSIALGIGIGTSSVIARNVGSGAREEVKRLGTHALLLVAGAMIALSFLGWATIDPVFMALGATAEVMPLIHSYLDIYYPSVVLFTTTMVAGNIMRANGSATIPGVVMTLGAALHLALDPFLIFGWFGLPRMELAGAATAMAISRIATVLVLLVYVSRNDMLLLRDVLPGFWSSCRRILHVGLPAMATQLIGPVSAAVITRMLAGHGEVVVAGFGVATRVEAVAVMLLFALSGSIGPFVGQNWGGSRPDRVKDGLRVTYQFCLIWGVVAALPLLAFGDVIAGWVDESPGVIATAAFYLAVVPWSYGLWGVLMMSSASFNALGKPLPSTMLSFTRMFILYIPLALLLNGLFGYPGIFVATAISNAIMGILGFLWFRQSFFPRGG